MRLIRIQGLLTGPISRLSVGLALAATLGAVIAGPWTLMDGTTAELILIVSAMCACLIPIAAAKYRGHLDVFELGIAVAITYFILFPLRSVVVLLGLDPLTNQRVVTAPITSVRMALAIVTLGLVAGGLAYNSSLGVRLGARVRFPRMPAIENPSLKLAWPLYLIGLTSQGMVLIWTSPGGNASTASVQLQSLVSEASTLMIIGLCLIARRAARATTHALRDAMPLIISLALGATVGIAGQFKETVLLVLLAPLVIWNYSRTSPIKPPAVIAMAVAVVIVVFPLVDLSRLASDRLHTRNPLAVVAALPDQALSYDWLAAGPRSGPMWTVAVDPMLIASHRLYGFDSLVLAVRYTPSQIPFQYGGTLRGLVEGLVPRLLWPGKPSIGIGFWFAVNYWGTPAGVLEVPQTVSHPGELWIDFGAPGVIVGLAVLGLWYRFAQAALQPRASGTGALICTVVFLSVVDVSRDIPLAYVTLLQRLVVLAILFGGLAIATQRPLLSIGRRVRLRHVTSAIDKLPECRNVLDAGCGDGLFAVGFALRHPAARVLAVDVDRTSLKASRKLANRPDNLSVTWAEVGGAILDSKFELVVCVDVMEHILHDGEAMKWLVTHLQPGGWLVLHVPARPQRHWLPSVKEAMREEIRAGKGPHLREGYQRDELRSLAENAGLNRMAIAYTFHTRITQIAADVETWTYLHNAKLLKAALLPLLLVAGAAERHPSRSRAGNGLLLVAQSSGTT